MNYIDRFPYVEPSLHPWDEAYLIVVNYSSDAFLDSVGQDFVQYFCINVHEGDWSEVLLPCLVFVSFRYKCYCASWHEFGSVTLTDFCMLNHPCIPGMKPTLSW